MFEEKLTYEITHFGFTD